MRACVLCTLPCLCEQILCWWTLGEGCITIACIWKCHENLSISSASHIGFSPTKMYFKTCLPQNSLAPSLLLLAIVISYLLASTPCAPCICSSLELCSADVRKHLRRSGLVSLLSHVCFLYLTHGFANTFIRLFFVCPDTENSPGSPDFWSNWKSSIKNALCLSRNSSDPSGATGLFQAAEGNHKDQKKASVSKHVILQECFYLSSLRKLHPPFQQEGGLAENSSGVIFQLQKL